MDFCEFLSEAELIDIVPNFTYDRQLHLITGDFGPFKPATPVRIPLWMALNLYGQQKCKVILPDWISDLDKLRTEQENSTGLIKMPSEHWREILRSLQKHQIAPSTEDSRRLIELRENIIKNSAISLLDGVLNLDEDLISQVKIRNITKFELTKFKNIILSNLAISKKYSKSIDQI